MNHPSVSTSAEPVSNAALGAVASASAQPPGSRPEARLEALVGQFYTQLHALASRELRGERAGHTLQPTALLHEAWLRIRGVDQANWWDDAELARATVGAMRRVLVDHARARSREKRPPAERRITLSISLQDSCGAGADVAAVHEALERLSALHPRQAEAVELRFFGGLSNALVARALGVSLRTAEGDWAMARAWLKRELGDRG